MSSRFARRALALQPSHHAGGVSSTRRDTRRTPRLFDSQEGGGSGDTSPERVRAAARSRQRNLATLTLLALSSTHAAAAGSGMPWEAPLQKILESVEGPVAKIVSVIIIIVTGVSLAFGDMGGGFRRLIHEM